jgi:hypothetical protein
VLGAGVAALAVDDHVGDAPERADLGDSGDDLAIPDDPELEILVGIDALRVDGELGHGLPPPGSSEGRDIDAGGNARP